MVSLFKKVVALATREGRNEGGFLATVWKRRLAIVAHTTMIDQAHYSLRKHLADDMDELYAPVWFNVALPTVSDVLQTRAGLWTTRRAVSPYPSNSVAFPSSPTSSTVLHIYVS